MYIHRDRSGELKDIASDRELVTTDSATVKHDLSDSWHSILRF